MATLAVLMIARELGPHPVGQFFAGMRGNPLVAAKPSAIPGAFVQGTPAIAIPTAGPTTPTTQEHFAVIQSTASIDIVVTPPNGDPNAAGLVVQTLLVPAAGLASIVAVMRPGENEVHIKSTT